MRATAVAVAVLLSACASSTVPQSDACQEILDKQCSARKACCIGSTNCAANPCQDAQQVCSGRTGEIDSTALEACLVDLQQYQCSNSATPVPQFGSDADACIAMYK